MRRRTSGAALVTVVLITLALYAIGLGLLTLALGELAASRAGARQLQARAAAESAIHVALIGEGTVWMDSIATGERRLVGSWSLAGAQATLEAQRLRRESWWLEGIGRVGVAESRTARLAWALDPAERVLALDAAVTVGATAPVTLAGTLDAATPLAVEPPLRSGDCDPWRDELGSRYAADPLRPLGWLASGDTMPRLGILALPDLIALSPVLLAGRGSPEPEESGGRCDVSAPWSWGDPDRPWRPCGGEYVLRGAAADLEVEGGVGQGVLVVDGNLALRDGARFYGWVLVRGELQVESGSELVGMAIATGGVHVESGSSVRASACWAALALAARRDDLGAFRLVAGAGSLGSF